MTAGPAPAVPPALEPWRNRPLWVWWRKERVKGRETKVPYQDARTKAKSNDPSTWKPADGLDRAGRFDGLGVMLGELQGIDLDACIDDDGVLETWAAEIVQRLDSYTEVSPSGRGVKIFVQGPAGSSAEVSFGKPVTLEAGQTKRREIAYYTGARYFTVTGRVWLDRPARKIDAGDVQFLRDRIEAQRQADRGDRSALPIAAPNPGARRAPARASLHADLLRLIRDGAPEGQRSERFHHAVRWCADCGLAEPAIVDLLAQHPEGIAAKFADRLPAEVARSLKGYTPKPGPTGRRTYAVEASTPRAVAPMHAAQAKPSAPDAQVAPDFAHPVPTARWIIGTRYVRNGQPTLHFWQGEFWHWNGTCYAVLPPSDVRQMLYEDGSALSPKPIKKRNVDDVLDALKACANLSQRAVPQTPAWIAAEPADPPPRTLIPVANGLVHVESGELRPPTPRLFAPYALPFDYAPDAPAPVHWLRFLASVWHDDSASIDALQEWFGYLLTADTGMQKGLLIVGPRRSGKGTMGRVLVRLLGERNVCSPTLGSLGSNFGTEPLIGKTLCLMSDARLGGRADIAAVAENLLRIIGEDSISIDRKFREAYTSRLLTRIVIFTNETPMFRDAASALPSRFIILQTTLSFLGREDHALDAKLAAELPGIMLWALQGLRRLRARGRFLQPTAGAAQLRMMEDLASPIGAFLREECVQEPGAQVPVSRLYGAWREWCREHGRDQPGTEQTFGRDIAAAAPGLGQSRPRIDGQRVRMYDGLRLRTPDDPEDLDDGLADA